MLRDAELISESQGAADAVRRLQGSVLGAKANFNAAGDAIEIVATINAASSTVTAAQFTAAHLGKTVAIPGAGASSANLVATVTAVVPGVSATISTPASVSVAGVDGYVGTDDTAAFVALRDAMAAGIVDPDTGAGNVKQACVGQLEAGEFLITSPEALMALTSAPHFGYSLRGLGDATRVICAFSTPGPLFHSVNQYLFPVVCDMTFVAVGGDPGGVDFAYSESSGVGQGWVWSNVHLQGNWRNGAKLGARSGVANGNDSWQWDHCFFGGTYGAPAAGGACLGSVFYSGVDTAGPAGQDQAVAHTFNSCYWTVQGCLSLIRLDYGGNVLVSGGSMVFGNVAGNANARAFYMGAIPVSHQSNTLSLRVEMMRFECRHTTSKIIESNWPGGEIVFDTCSADYSATPPTQVLATFDAQTGRGPTVTWRNCQLPGKHEYKFRQNEYLQGPKRVSYLGCILTQGTEPKDFITYTDVSGTGAIGSRPQIHFDEDTLANVAARDSRSFGVTLGWRTTPGGNAGTKMYSVGKTNFGVNVTNGATWTTRLPPNVTVKAIHYRMPANGANTTAGMTIAVKDSGGSFIDPAGLFTIPGAWNAGWERHVELPAWKDLADGQVQVTVAGSVASSTLADIYLECLPAS